MANELLHSPADVVRQLVLDLGLGTDPDDEPGEDWPVFAHSLPDLPDAAMAVTDTAGRDHGSSQLTGELFTAYGWQLRVRGVTHAGGAWQKADECRRSLSERCTQRVVTLANLTGTDTTDYTVHCLHGFGQVLTGAEPSSAGRRTVFSLNGLISLTRRP